MTDERRLIACGFTLVPGYDTCSVFSGQLRVFTSAHTHRRGIARSGRSIVVLMMLILSVEGGAQENEKPAPPTATGIRACVVSPRCFGSQLGPAKAEMLSEPGERVAAQATSQQRSWVRRHPVLTSSLIGAGIGATLAATGGTEPGTRRSAQIVFMTGVGAGTGALVGLAFR
jgi:hypothetical protein